MQATNRVIVSNADWDGLLLTNGTLLSIQNMTWAGKLGELWHILWSTDADKDAQVFKPSLQAISLSIRKTFNTA